MVWKRRHQPAVAVLAAMLLLLGLVRWRGRTMAAPAPGESGDLASQPGLRLDPNVATEAELAAVPGIGSGRARAIVFAREEGAVFRELRDLRSVKGIGEASLARAEKYLTFPTP